MVLFHFRVHIDNIDLSLLLTYIKSNSVTTLIVKEMGERPHIHCIISPTKTVSTFRQNFIKSFPQCKGNKCYSLEEVKDSDHLIVYLCKGTETTMPEVLFNKDVDISVNHKKYWELNKKLRENNGVVSTSKSNKQKVLPWLTQVKNEFQKENAYDVMVLQEPIETMWKPDDVVKATYKCSQQKLLSHILKKLGNSVKVLDDTVLIRMYKGIHNAFIQDGEHTEKYASCLLDKLNL